LAAAGLLRAQEHPPIRLPDPAGIPNPNPPDAPYRPPFLTPVLPAQLHVAFDPAADRFDVTRRRPLPLSATAHRLRALASADPCPAAPPWMPAELRRQCAARPADPGAILLLHLFEAADRNSHVAASVETMADNQARTRAVLERLSALARRPDPAVSRSALLASALAAHMAGGAEQSTPLARRAAELLPDCDAAWDLYLGILADRDGTVDPELARDCVRRRDSARARALLAGALVGRGRWDEAGEAVRAAVERDVEDPVVCSYLAAWLLSRADPDSLARADQLLTTLAWLRSSPAKSGVMTIAYSRCYQDTEQTDLAVFQAVLQACRGEKLRARIALENILRQKPNCRNAKAALAGLTAKS
jgi:hypothetical protein